MVFPVFDGVSTSPTSTWKLVEGTQGNDLERKNEVVGTIRRVTI